MYFRLHIKVTIYMCSLALSSPLRARFAFTKRSTCVYRSFCVHLSFSLFLFIFIRNSTLKGSDSASHNKMRKERVRKSEQKLKLHIRNIILIRLTSVEFKIYILEQICVFSCCFFMTTGINTTVCLYIKQSFCHSENSAGMQLLKKF